MNICSLLSMGTFWSLEFLQILYHLLYMPLLQGLLLRVRYNWLKFSVIVMYGESFWVSPSRSWKMLGSQEILPRQHHY